MCLKVKYHISTWNWGTYEGVVGTEYNPELETSLFLENQGLYLIKNRTVSSLIPI